MSETNNQTIIKRRIEYIDCAKFFGIFLLLIEHTGNWINRSGIVYQNLKLWICSFHMPLFFIIYGMVSSYKPLKCWNQYKEYLYHQFKTLIVPYILWSMIYSNGFGINFFLGVGYGSNASLNYANTNSVLWFLPAMFMSTLIYQLILEFISSKTNKQLYVNVSILALVLIIIAFASQKVGDIRFPWGIDIACLGATFMLIGRYFVKDVVNIINKMKALKKIIFTFFLALIGVAISIINKPVDGIYPVTVMAIAEYGKKHSFIYYWSIS